MCRNIKTLYNFDPPATKAEIRALALQFVRQLSGFNSPSKLNERAFNLAVDQVREAANCPHQLAFILSPPRDREVEQAKNALLWAKRFGRS